MDYTCKYLVIYFKKENDSIQKKSEVYTSNIRMSELRHKSAFAASMGIPSAILPPEKYGIEEGIKSFRLTSVNED